MNFYSFLFLSIYLIITNIIIGDFKMVELKELEKTKADIAKSLGLEKLALIGPKFILPSICLDCLRPVCFLRCAFNRIRPGWIIPK